MKLAICIGGADPPDEPGIIERRALAVPSAGEIACLMSETGAESYCIVDGSGSASCAVIVVAHEPYLPYVPTVCAAWDLEMPGAERVLVLDNVPGDFALPGWRIVRTSLGHPSGARNAGLEGLVAEWVHFWDADNVVPEGIGARVRSALAGARVEVGYFGPWAREHDLRDGYGVDTNGLWRVAAVRMAGGWPNTKWLEDWALGGRIQALGFRAARWDSGTVRQGHPGQRSKVPTAPHERVWSARIMTVITLQRSVSGLQRWIEAWGKQIRPQEHLVRLIIVCEGDDVEAFARSVAWYGSTVTILKSGSYPLVFGAVTEAERHSRVSGLFLRAGQFVGRDSHLVLTWEDDVFPQRRDALFELSRALPIDGDVGAVGGAYPGRSNRRLAVASSRTDEWHAMWALKTLPPEPLVVGCTGAGFTLFRARILEHLAGPDQRPGVPLGWDMCAGDMARRLGLRVLLHGGVICDHGAY